MIEEIRKQTICTAATKAEKETFRAFCRGHGISPSAMVRLLISKVCPDISAGELSEKIATRQNNQMLLTWHDRDWSALDKVAKENGISRQQWIRRKVRATIHNTTPATDEELRALAQSNRELNAIGRNLNQIARRLNESNGEDNQMTLDYITNFAKLVEAHTDKVGYAMRAAYGRYGEILSD